MLRWLTVVLGVGIAVAALYALLATRPAPRSAPLPPPASTAAHEEIDDASRLRLEQVLREADAHEEGAR